MHKIVLLRQGESTWNQEHGYANLPSSRFPRTGCLKDTVERET